MTIAEILLEKVYVEKNGLATICAYGCYCTGMRKMTGKLFSGQCRWLQTPTPVLPMMRKSMMWNLPNPMVSTASSTVNVFCPEHQRKIKQQKLSAVKLYLLFMKSQHFSYYCGTAPGKRLEISTSYVSTDQPLYVLVARNNKELLKQQPAGMEGGQPCTL